METTIMEIEIPKHEHLYSCLGEVIKSRRKKLELSQEQLAAGAGIDRAFLSNLERGQRKPSFGTVASIARGLKIKYSRLVAKCETCQSERDKKICDLQ
jgi:transcriptional regulator with XRE-family HTH domain